MVFLQQQIASAVASGDRFAQQAYTGRYDQYVKSAKALLSENNPQRQGALTNQLNKVLSEAYYLAAAKSQKDNTPGIKPVTSAKPKDVMDFR